MSRERFVGIDVGWVTKAIDRAGAALAEAVKASPAWRAKDALLPSIPGVGPVAALTLRAGPPGLGATTGGRLAALVGLAPLAADSRTRQGGRHTRGGRAPVRRALYLAAPSAAAHNPALRAFEERLVARGEEPKVALAAAARKLLAIADAVIQPGQPWRAEVAGDVASSTRPGSQSLLPAAGAISRALAAIRKAMSRAVYSVAPKVFESSLVARRSASARRSSAAVCWRAVKIRSDSAFCSGVKVGCGVRRAIGRLLPRGIFDSRSSSLHCDKKATVFFLRRPLRGCPRAAANARSGEGGAAAGARVRHRRGPPRRRGASGPPAELAGVGWGGPRGYFEPHAGHAGYADRLRPGQSIGGGLVEGACKQGVGRRVKQTGARWQVRRVERMATLCAARATDQWAAYWQRSD